MSYLRNSSSVMKENIKFNFIGFEPNDQFTKCTFVEGYLHSNNREKQSKRARTIQKIVRKLKREKLFEGADIEDERRTR